MQHRREKLLFGEWPEVCLVGCVGDGGLNSRLPAFYAIFLACCFLTELFTRLTDGRLDQLACQRLRVCRTGELPGQPAASLYVQYDMVSTRPSSALLCVDIAANSELFTFFDCNCSF